MTRTPPHAATENTKSRGRTSRESEHGYHRPAPTAAGPTSTLARLATVDVPCPSCGVRPGSPCLTVGGSVTQPHRPRKQVAARRRNDDPNTADLVRLNRIPRYQWWAIRRDAGWDDDVEFADLAGVPRSAVRRFEAGHARPSSSPYGGAYAAALMAVRDDATERRPDPSVDPTS